MLIILSVFNGFEDLFIHMYSNFDADIRITPHQGKVFKIDSLPVNKLLETGLIKNYTFTREENALLRYNHKQTIATIKAVDDNYIKTNPLDSNVLKGYLSLHNGDTNFAWVGQGIGYQLGIDPDDQFNYLGIYLPAKGRIDLSNPEGAFHHGIVFPIAVFGVQEEVDNKYVILPISYLYDLEADSATAGSLELRLADGNSPESVKKEIAQILGNNFDIKTRYEQRDSFFKVMQSEKTISYFILVFILLIAAFNTIGSLYMLVMEKRKDLTVLSYLGMIPQKAAAVFVFQSMLIAITGGLIGIALGTGIVLLQEKFGIVVIPADGNMAINAYPVKFKLSDPFIVFFTLLVLGLITSIYPAERAFRFVSEKN